MAGRSGSPTAVKTEEQSQSVVFTYFQGDISSMVDEHFTRALSKTSKTKSASGKSKKGRKSVKSEDANSCQWSVPSWSDGPITGRLQLNAKEPHSSLPLALSSPDNAPRPWPFAPRQGGGLGLTPMTYSHVMSPEGLSVTGQQYTNSLLNLLHSDRAEVASGSKPDLLPSWTGHPGFRDPMNPAAMGLDSGIVPEKKDLYWY